MKKKILAVVLLILVSLFTGGGCNIFSDVAEKTSDEAIVDDVVNHIDSGKYYDAIMKWNLLTPTGKAKRQNIVLLASAYAGRGNLDTLRIIKNLNDNASAATPDSLFLTLMKAFKGSTINHFNDQVTAEGILQTISTNASNRTVDENLFMIFVEFAKLGTLHAALADANSDGVVDGAYDNCTIVRNHSNHIVSAIANIIQSIAATGTSIAGTSLSDLQANCSNYYAAALCSSTIAANVTDDEARAGETMSGENNLNLGLKLRSGAKQYEFVDPCPNCPGGSVAAAPPPNNLCPL